MPLQFHWRWISSIQYFTTCTLLPAGLLRGGGASEEPAPDAASGLQVQPALQEAEPGLKAAEGRQRGHSGSRHRRTAAPATARTAASTTTASTATAASGMT